MNGDMANRKPKEEWIYYFGDPPKFAMPMKTGRPRIGRKMIVDGEEWMVWYVEEGPGVRNARLEKGNYFHMVEV